MKLSANIVVNITRHMLFSCAFHLKNNNKRLSKKSILNEIKNEVTNYGASWTNEMTFDGVGAHVLYDPNSPYFKGVLLFLMKAFPDYDYDEEELLLYEYQGILID